VSGANLKLFNILLPADNMKAKPICRTVVLRKAECQHAKARPRQVSGRVVIVPRHCALSARATRVSMRTPPRRDFAHHGPFHWRRNTAKDYFPKYLLNADHCRCRFKQWTVRIVNIQDVFADFGRHKAFELFAQIDFAAFNCCKEEPTRGYLTRLEARMTPEQVAEAKRLAREFKPHKSTDH
jgi:hypothetical protein